jgi:hypothetical protein
MAIFFRCVCGQDLRALEEQAGAAKDCPACGRSMPVPTLAQANETLGIPVIPALELPRREEAPTGRRQPACAALPDSASPWKIDAPGLPAGPDLPYYRLAPQVGVDLDQVQEILQHRDIRWLYAQARRELNDRQRRAAAWPTERYWFECLLYPLRACAILLSLAALGAILIGLGVLLYPDEWELAELWPRLPLLLLGFLVLGYTLAFYHYVLAYAAEGEAGLIRWPAAEMLWSGLAGVVCFLAGPAVPLTLAFLFWLNSGDLESLDELILWELGLVASATWVLALLAVDENGRLRDANPVAVARFAMRLGWRGWLLVALIAGALTGHVYLALLALEELHRSMLGWIILASLAFTDSVWQVFLLRWYGLSLFWRLRPNDLAKTPSRQGLEALHRFAG